MIRDTVNWQLNPFYTNPITAVSCLFSCSHLDGAQNSINSNYVEIDNSVTYEGYF